jgi:hypothetical protein
MFTTHKFQQTLLHVASISVLTFGLIAAKTAAAVNVTTTVTAVGKKNTPPPTLKKEDVQVYEGKERVQIVDWKRGEELFLGVLIDDSLDTSFGTQINDVKQFIESQPPSTYVAVAYARNGSAQILQDFTTNHELAARAVRLPLGGFGQAFTSPYLTLQDWTKRWPNSGPRRSIVMITSGIDYFRGGFDPIDPDLDTTIELAQKQNINMWTIYYPSAGHAGERFFRVFNAEANLARLSEESGAENFYLSEQAPVTLKPYFDEIAQHLANQYLLTFIPAKNPGKKGRFDRVRVVTEIPNVEFLTPSEVFLPPSE